jgi:hypothetical protein
VTSRRGYAAHATVAAALAAAVVAAGCAAAVSPSPSPTASAVATAAFRPSSPAVVAITAPKRGDQITGPAVHVTMTLAGARIVDTTTTAVTPTEGHIHLLVNGAVTTMNYGLEQDLGLPPGTYVLKAEFVAADHAPFNPRVYSDEIFITVR